MKLKTKIEIDYPEVDGKYYLVLEELESLTGRKSKTMGLTKTELKKFLGHNTCVGMKGIYPVFSHKIRKTEDIIQEWMNKEEEPKIQPSLKFLKEALFEIVTVNKKDEDVVMRIVSHPDNKLIDKKYSVPKNSFME